MNFALNDLVHAKLSNHKVISGVVVGLMTFGFYAIKTPDSKIHFFHYSDMTKQDRIPARHRLHAFNSMAFWIGKTLDTWPQCTIIDPKPLAPSTFARKLRECIAAKQLYGHKHSMVDEALFEAIYFQIVVSEQDGLVYSGPRDTIKNDGQKQVGLPVVKSELAPIEFNFQTPEQLEQFCLLLHNKVFSPRPIFIIKGINQSIADDLENRFDIGLIPHNDVENKWEVV